MQAQLVEHSSGSDVARWRGLVVERAVAAYIRGVGLGPSTPDAYTEVARAKHAELVTNLVASRVRRDEARAAVERFEGAVPEPAQAIARMQAHLDAIDVVLAAQRTAEEREADAARKRALQAALAQPSLTPRHKRATTNQAELMRKWPFGPLPDGDGLPAGLVASGELLSGLASWYGPGFNGRATASGAIYDQEGWTVASPTIPLGTFLVVEREGKRALLLVNDRGPYIPPRVLDLSHAAAVHLGVGVNPVNFRVVVPG